MDRVYASSSPAFGVIRSIGLFLLITVLTTVPLIFLGMYTYGNLDKALTHSALDRRLALARLGSISIQERIDHLIDVGQVQAQNDQVIQLISQGKWQEAVEKTKLVGINPWVDRVFMADTKGTEMSAYPLDDPTVIGQNFAFRDWYVGVSKEWKPYISEVYQRSAQPRINLIALAIPIFSSTTEPMEPVGILVIQLKLDAFRIFSDSEDPGVGVTYVVDHRGNLVSRPDVDTTSELIMLSENAPVKNVLLNQSGYLEHTSSVDGVYRLSSYWPVTKYGWGVVNTQDYQTAFENRDQQLNRLSMVWLLLVALSLLSAAVLLYFIIRLFQANRFEQIILESIGEGVIVVNEKGRILRVNSNVEKITGFTRDEMLGQVMLNFFDYFDPEGEVIPIEDRPTYVVLNKKQIKQDQYLLRRKKNGVVPVEVIAAPILDQGVLLGGVSVISDITERYQLNKAKDEFITTAAHQLNSPLGRIRWNLDYFVKRFARGLPSEAKKVLADAHDNTISLAALVSDLLIASRVTQNRLQEHPTPIKPVENLKKLMEELEPFIKEKKLEGKVHSVGNIPSITLDQLSFKQVFENLLRNAINYNRVKGKIDVIVQVEGSELQISVADTGIGIPKKDITSLFGKFYRASNVANDGITGTGLGLFVVKSYVERWGGRVWVESEEGVGTTVYVRIPLS